MTDKTDNETMRICNTCNETMPISNFSRNNKYRRHTCSKCRSNDAVKKRAELRKLIDDYSGDSCTICGRKRTEETRAAFHHHHVNSAEKGFEISQVLRDGKGTSLKTAWRRIRTELDKTVYLCAFCHARIHYGEKNNDQRNTYTH